MNPENRENRSILNTLRALVPQRRASFAEALRVAEQQAQRLLRNVTDVRCPVSEDLVMGLPRINIEYVGDMPTSGCSFWDSAHKTWIIQINRGEPSTRQRFTLFHEYKHIVDHGLTDQLYGTGPDAGKHSEQAADYFAGCVLMSRPLLKRAWGQGIQTAERLAAHFAVSVVAARVRLAQVGLTDGRVRCAVPDQPQFAPSKGRTPRSYYRQLTPGFGATG